MIVYTYVRPGETFDCIPGRDLTEAEFKAALKGRDKAERALINTLYERAEVADPAPTPAPAPIIEAPAVVADDGIEEDTDDGNTDRI